MTTASAAGRSGMTSLGQAGGVDPIAPLHVPLRAGQGLLCAGTGPITQAQVGVAALAPYRRARRDARVRPVGVVRARLNSHLAPVEGDHLPAGRAALAR